MHEEEDSLCLRVDMEVNASAFHAFLRLSDLRLRSCWDQNYLYVNKLHSDTPCSLNTKMCYCSVFLRSCKEVEKADEEETVYHVNCATINGGKCRDFVFLLSKRQPCKDG